MLQKIGDAGISSDSLATKLPLSPPSKLVSSPPEDVTSMSPNSESSTKENSCVNRAAKVRLPRRKSLWRSLMIGWAVDQRPTQCKETFEVQTDLKGSLLLSKFIIANSEFKENLFRDQRSFSLLSGALERSFLQVPFFRRNPSPRLRIQRNRRVNSSSLNRMKERRRVPPPITASSDRRSSTCKSWTKSPRRRCESSLRSSGDC